LTWLTSAQADDRNVDLALSRRRASGGLFLGSTWSIPSPIRTLARNHRQCVVLILPVSASAVNRFGVVCVKNKTAVAISYLVAAKRSRT
jgi:hypothetical protein